MRLQDDCSIFGSLMPALVKSAGSTFPLEVHDKVQLPKKNKYKDQSSFKPIISYDYHNFKKSVLFHLGVFFLEQETCIPLIQIALEFFASIFFCLQLHLRTWTLLPLLLSIHIWQYLTCMSKLKTLTYTHHLYMHLDIYIVIIWNQVTALISNVFCTRVSLLWSVGPLFGDNSDSITPPPFDLGQHYGSQDQHIDSSIAALLLGARPSYHSRYRAKCDKKAELCFEVSLCSNKMHIVAYSVIFLSCTTVQLERKMHSIAMQHPLPRMWPGCFKSSWIHESCQVQYVSMIIISWTCFLFSWRCLLFIFLMSPLLNFKHMHVFVHTLSFWDAKSLARTWLSWRWCSSRSVRRSNILAKSASRSATLFSRATKSASRSATLCSRTRNFSCKINKSRSHLATRSRSARRSCRSWSTLGGSSGMLSSERERRRSRSCQVSLRRSQLTSRIWRLSGLGERSWAWRLGDGDRPIGAKETTCRLCGFGVFLALPGNAPKEDLGPGIRGGDFTRPPRPCIIIPCGPMACAACACITSGDLARLVGVFSPMRGTKEPTPAAGGVKDPGSRSGKCCRLKLTGNAGKGAACAAGAVCAACACACACGWGACEPAPAPPICALGRCTFCMVIWLFCGMTWCTTCAWSKEESKETRLKHHAKKNMETHHTRAISTCAKKIYANFFLVFSSTW